MTLDASCTKSLFLFAQTDAVARVGAFSIQISTCPCWLCRHLNALFAQLPREVPDAILLHYSFHNYLHFCLYPFPDCDLN